MNYLALLLIHLYSYATIEIEIMAKTVAVNYYIIVNINFNKRTFSYAN